MSTKFPNLPTVIGDTDDEASIHLYNKVGPAKPLSVSGHMYDQEVENILNESDNESDDDDGRDYNKDYEAYRSNKYTGFDVFSNDNGLNDDFEDDTEVEEPSKENANQGNASRKLTISKKANTNMISIAKHPIIYAIVFTVLPLVIAMAISDPRYLSGSSTIKSSIKLDSINKSMARLQEITQQLTETQNESARIQEIITDNLGIMTNDLNTKFEIISSKFQDIEKKLSSINNNEIEILDAKLNEVKSQMDAVLNISDHDGLDSKLSEFTRKLNEITNTPINIQNIKQEILNELMDLLPTKLPVYIKDKKLQSAPEFYKFLYSFIENYNKESKIANLETIEDFVKQYVDRIKLEDSNFTEDQLKTFILTKLQENQNEIMDKVNELIGKIYSSIDKKNADNTLGQNCNSTEVPLFKDTSSNILLDNFASYRFGARILGFLTTTGGNKNDKANRSIARRLFIGWYDYLVTDSVISNPVQWKFNANNVLLDGGEDWHCQSNECSIGIRLIQKIIPTDISIKNPSYKANIEGPQKISIYVKPKTSQDRIKLMNQLIGNNKQNIEKEVNNKYLKKFVKIKEVNVDNEKKISYIRMPATLINLKIPVQDIYMSFKTKSPESQCGISTIKVFGISEYNYNILDEESNHAVEYEEYSKEFESSSNHLGFDELLY